MPKYRIAETLRVELTIDAQSPDKAVKMYMEEFLLLFNTDRQIDCKTGEDFIINKVNDNGSIGEEVDPCDAEIDTPPAPTA
jgi:hypothetical protein